ncbi:hypothetical protein QBC42DRAFT_288906 [Cladorrhinum samala]|uniref:SWIRM domain-containing protein n=1 Tax=Cladorrhinum samala TaxID=585594 RepID=A0AAV9HL88_9PEZI|nr:hypothetical protein QBC42DRAFT_288906 [Cladorrhinum samala]
MGLSPHSSSSSSLLPQTPKSDMTTMRASMHDIKHVYDPRSLMSPPEQPPLDVIMVKTLELHRVPNPPLSPPVSPGPEALHDLTAKDPILFPPVEQPGSPVTLPLFTQPQEPLDAARAQEEKLMNEHIASRPASLFTDVPPPKREDYELVLYFKSNCFKMFSHNPRAWLRKEKALLRADRKPASVNRPMYKLPHILPAERAALPVPQIPKTSVARVQKPKSPTVKAAQPPRPLRATPGPTRQTIRVNTTPEPRQRTVAPNREDKDFNSLEDLCPPLSSLPPKSNSLKVDWKGNALDLSNDPHRHLLHPDELILASNLRLDCATYLTSKRRIFLRRLECARINKEFRKTDAQQACKIDVNKASKLWQAYEKVGWLNIKWVQEHLARRHSH